MKKRNLRAAAIQQRKLDDRRKIKIANTIREIALVEIQRDRVRDELAAAETTIALAEGAGAEMGRSRAEIEVGRRALAVIDRQLDDLKRTAGLVEVSS